MVLIVFSMILIMGFYLFLMVGVVCMRFIVCTVFCILYWCSTWLHKVRLVLYALSQSHLLQVEMLNKTNPMIYHDTPWLESLLTTKMAINTSGLDGQPLPNFTTNIQVLNREIIGKPEKDHSCSKSGCLQSLQTTTCSQVFALSTMQTLLKEVLKISLRSFITKLWDSM